MGSVEDPKLIHMVMIAHFWPTNQHPDDEGRVSNLQFTISQHKVDKSQSKINNNDFKLLIKIFQTTIRLYHGVVNNIWPIIQMMLSHTKTN